MEKICFKCSQIKPLTDYYKHPQMGDGHLGKCKECTKKDVSNRLVIKMQDPDFVEDERRRGREKGSRLAKKKPSKEMKSKAIKDYSDKYPEKRGAASAAQHARASNGCHNHHWSYNKEHWKDVIHISIKEHALIHCYMAYDQERMMYRVSCQLDGFVFGELLSTRERHEQFIDACVDKFSATHYRPLKYPKTK